MVCMERIEQKPDTITARDLGLVACTRCQQVWPITAKTCQRCGHSLQSRDHKSLQRVWAFWLIGVLCYVPANVYPMLETRALFYVQKDTILGGAIGLIEYGSWGVGLVIILASVIIPLGKFLAIAFLALSVQRPSRISHHHRQKLFEVVEYIGRWSMIDIFVVAILSSLVQLNILLSIYPGPATLFFAFSVIFTMFSAQAFDSRMIWDCTEEKKDKRNDD
ncbi:MAG: paraquat-inducible protein A [Roseobacter sp.]